MGRCSLQAAQSSLGGTPKEGGGKPNQGFTTTTAGYNANREITTMTKIEEQNAYPSDQDLRELEKIIGKPILPPAPQIGVAASEAMIQCYEDVANKIEAVAQDAVDRAMALLQEAKSFASILRQSGEILADRIKLESARAAMVSDLIKRTRAAVADNPPALNPSMANLTLDPPAVYDNTGETPVQVMNALTFEIFVIPPKHRLVLNEHQGESEVRAPDTNRVVPSGPSKGPAPAKVGGLGAVNPGPFAQPAATTEVPGMEWGKDVGIQRKPKPLPY